MNPCTEKKGMFMELQICQATSTHSYQVCQLRYQLGKYEIRISLYMCISKLYVNLPIAFIKDKKLLISKYIYWESAKHKALRNTWGKVSVYAVKATMFMSLLYVPLKSLLKLHFVREKNLLTTAYTFLHKSSYTSHKVFLVKE